MWVLGAASVTTPSQGSGHGPQEQGLLERTGLEPAHHHDIMTPSATSTSATVSEARSGGVGSTCHGRNARRGSSEALRARFGSGRKGKTADTAKSGESGPKLVERVS